MYIERTLHLHMTHLQNIDYLAGSETQPRKKPWGDGPKIILIAQNIEGGGPRTNFHEVAGGSSQPGRAHYKLQAKSNPAVFVFKSSTSNSSYASHS